MPLLKKNANYNGRHNKWFYSTARGVVMCIDMRMLTDVRYAQRVLNFIVFHEQVRRRRGIVKMMTKGNTKWGEGHSRMLQSGQPLTGGSESTSPSVQPETTTLSLQDMIAAPDNDLSWQPSTSQPREPVLDFLERTDWSTKLLLYFTVGFNRVASILHPLSIGVWSTFT